MQEGRDLAYREVLARCLEAVAAIEGRPLATGDRFALAESLPSWPPFPEVPDGLAELRERGWRLGILSNTDPDLLAASVGSIGVEVDLRVTAAEAGSYKPAHGHWERFFAVTRRRSRPSRPRGGEPVPRHRACGRPRDARGVDQPARGDEPAGPRGRSSPT